VQKNKVQPLLLGGRRNNRRKGETRKASEKKGTTMRGEGCCYVNRANLGKKEGDKPHRGGNKVTLSVRNMRDPLHHDSKIEHEVRRFLSTSRRPVGQSSSDKQEKERESATKVYENVTVPV